MKSNNFIITGCQRSGTTLLKLILDSHSNISVFDEDVAGFHGEKIKDYCEQNVINGFKLPMVSNNLNLLTSLNYKILFLVRDPRDVILSMQKLMIKFNAGYMQDAKLIKEPYISTLKCIIKNNRIFDFLSLFFLIKKHIVLPWIIHPAGIGPELRPEYFSKHLRDEKEKFMKSHPLCRKSSDHISLASHVWLFKNSVLADYNKINLTYLVIKYEELVSSPESTIKEISKFLNVRYEPETLLYYKKNSGTSIGNTRNDNPIMNKNFNKYHGSYTKEQLEKINSICKDVAKNFEYNL